MAVSSSQLSLGLIKGDVIIESLNTGPSASDSPGVDTFLAKGHGVWHVQCRLVRDVSALNSGSWRSPAIHFRRVCDLAVRFLTPGVLITS